MLPSPLPVFVISLERDRERFETTRSMFDGAENFAVERSPGVQGGDLPGLATRLLTGRAGSEAGSLGCFLAHVGAWEKVAASSAGWGLVMEDDTVLHDIGGIFRAAIPVGAELIWVNTRMNPDVAPGEGPARLRPARDLLAVKARAPRHGGAPGGDGYLLSAAGAEKLLAAVKADGFDGHVDWRLWRYAVSAADVDACCAGTWLATVAGLQRDTLRHRWSVVSGWSLAPPLVGLRPGTTSVRAASSSDRSVARTTTPEGSICEFELYKRRFRMLVTDPGDVIQKLHYRGKLYEREELDIIRRHFRQGDVYVDVGSNVGNHLVFVGKVLRPSQIIAFEPNPEAIRILLQNIALNGLKELVDTRFLGHGLSDGAGRAEMRRRAGNLGATGLSATEDGGIPIATGDQMMAGRRMDFIKMDVGGMELAALRGLEGAIARNRPALLVDVQDRNREAFDNWAADMTYSVVERFRRYRTGENVLLMPA